MFRLFLKEKIQHGRPEKKNNRRSSERYGLEHKHLTMMNEQDIFLIKEMSSTGFSSQVSERAFERLAIGDIYVAKIRYGREIYDLKARVSWKSNHQVGFEMKDADKDTLKFMERLIHPMALAQSMKKVEANFTKEPTDHKTWYHGDQDTDLYVWYDHQQELVGWQLVNQESFVDWNPTAGMRTGFLTVDQTRVLDVGSSALQTNVEAKLNRDTLQFARDLLFSLAIEERDDILETMVDL